MSEEEHQGTMELSNLLAIDNFMLVEESYAGQKWLDRTLEYMGKIKEGDVLEVVRIYDERNDLLGIALRDKDLAFWIIFTDVIADALQKEEFETRAHQVKGGVERAVAVKREQFLAGVIEFYSVGLVNRLFCDCAVTEESFYPRDRIEALKNVVGEFLTDYGIGLGETTSVLEIGCGNGGGTIALHELGISPLTVDVNRCEICKGLEEGILNPKKSIVLDCSRLSTFYQNEFDIVFGFMVGKLTPFERFNWEKVLREVPKVLKRKGKVFLTVSSEEETGILEELLESDFVGLMKENKESNGYFDQWLYMGELKE